ncbi:MAG: hypothetical protein WBR35_11530 [Anaerolineae bacterium]
MADHVMGGRMGIGSLWAAAVDAVLQGLSDRVDKQARQLADLTRKYDALAAELASIKSQGGAVAEEDHG